MLSKWKCYHNHLVWQTQVSCCLHSTYIGTVTCQRFKLCLKFRLQIKFVDQYQEIEIKQYLQERVLHSIPFLYQCICMQYSYFPDQLVKHNCQTDKSWVDNASLQQRFMRQGARWVLQGVVTCCRQRGQSPEIHCDKPFPLFREEMPRDIPPPSFNIMTKILTWFQLEPPHQAIVH